MSSTTTIQITEKTRKNLAIFKTVEDCKNYDEAITKLLTLSSKNKDVEVLQNA